jgi:VWFA-related protein
VNKLLFLFAAAAFAQQPGPTFRTGTELIQVSVVAQDKQGKPVMDLKREEFTLLDNGAPREISTFALERAADAAPSVAAPGTFTNRLAPRSAGGSGSRSGYSVILIDNILASFGDAMTQEEGAALARVQTLKMLRSMPPDEKIAIYATKRKVQIVCEFTSDRDLLERRLQVWKPSPDNPDTSDQAFKDALAGGSRFNAEQYAAAVQRQREEAGRVDMMLRNTAEDVQMESIAGHLAGIPGRKNLIWLSNRFAMSGRAIEKFKRANVAIYPVDMDGVCHICSPRPTQIMDAIAAATGGLAYYHRNDIDTAMREAVDDGRVSYTLGFYQSDEDASPQVHQLALRVSRPGITLRYRSSYQPGPVKAQGTPASELIEALDRPVNATGIPFQAKVTRDGNELKLDVRLDAASLDLVPQGGLWTGKIECLARFMTAEGMTARDEEAQTMTLNLRQATYETGLEQGLAYRKQLKIPATASELRLLFANLATGKIGTLSIQLSEVKGSVPGAN